MTKMNLCTGQKRTHRHREWTCSCQGKRRIGRLGLGDAKHYTENASTRRYCMLQRTVLYPVMNHMEKNIEKSTNGTESLSHCAAQPTLTQHCKSATF